jgi:pimeloyl-ACP methyl ester carboxylesterase
MAYWEWGERDNPRVLVCVHGLTRQGRDFDALARALCAERRVVCPDVAGRGESDWLADPAGYAVPSYVADMVSLLARLDVEQLDWLGTSMGGLIGMGLASLPARSGAKPVRRLVLNDVGPAIEPEAIARIASYVGRSMHFASLDEAADYLHGISQGFGIRSRERWLELTRPMLKPEGEGLRLHYDPQIALPIRAITPETAKTSEAALWRAYDAIACPTLLLRGADSDLLSRATARAMTERGPKAKLHEFAGIGHAPMLIDDEQIEVVRAFLAEAPS